VGEGVGAAGTFIRLASLATLCRRERGFSGLRPRSHLLQLVEELCTKLLVISHGHAVAYGALSDIVAGRPELTGRTLEEIFLSVTGSGEPAAP